MFIIRWHLLEWNICNVTNTPVCKGKEKKDVMWSIAKFTYLFYYRKIVIPMAAQRRVPTAPRLDRPSSLLAPPPLRSHRNIGVLDSIAFVSTFLAHHDSIERRRLLQTLLQKVLSSIALDWHWKIHPDADLRLPLRSRLCKPFYLFARLSKKLLTFYSPDVLLLLMWHQMPLFCLSSSPSLEHYSDVVVLPAKNIPLHSYCIHLSNCIYCVNLAQLLAIQNWFFFWS